MRSYDSPGRTVTIINAGPGAVPVQVDQPYRLREHQGITGSTSGLGEELTLATEGVFMRMVELAPGVAAARDGDLVHLSTDGTWRLVAGYGQAGADGFVPFGLLGDALVRKDLARVKLMPATARAVAGGAAAVDPKLADRVAAAEAAITALQGVDVGEHATDASLDARVGANEKAIAALQAAPAPVAAIPAGTTALLADAADRTNWRPMRGGVWSRSGNPTLSPLFPADAGVNAADWTSPGASTSNGNANGGLIYFKGVFVIGSANAAYVNTTANGSSFSQRSPTGNAGPVRAWATDGTTLYGFGSAYVTKSIDAVAFAGTSLAWTGTAPSSGYTVFGALWDAGAGELLVVGNSGTSGAYDLIGVTTDGVNVARQTTTINRALYDVAAGTIGGTKVYLAVGDAGTIVRSTDKRNWTALNSRCSQPLRRVVFDPGTSRFIVFGDGGRLVVCDGTNCDPSIFDAAMGTIAGAAIGGGVVVVVGTSGAIDNRSRIKVLSLADLSTAQDRLLDGSTSRTAFYPEGLAYGGGRFLMMAQQSVNGSAYDFAATSSAPALDPTAQFVIPFVPSPAPGTSWWIRA